MASSEQLAKEHGAIEQLAAGLVDMLDLPEPDPEATAAAFRVLATELHEHLAIEDSAIYPRLITAADPGAAATAERFNAELAALKQDWQAFRIEWSDEAIRDDWPIFLDEGHAMLKRIRARLQAENDLLYPVALQRSIIPLRSPETVWV